MTQPEADVSPCLASPRSAWPAHPRPPTKSQLAHQAPAKPVQPRKSAKPPKGPCQPSCCCQPPAKLPEDHRLHLLSRCCFPCSQPLEPLHHSRCHWLRSPDLLRRRRWSCGQPPDLLRRQRRSCSRPPDLLRHCHWSRGRLPELFYYGFMY